MRNITAFIEEYKPKKAIVVSCEPNPRLVGNILVLPWQEFLDRLWAGDII